MSDEKKSLEEEFAEFEAKAEEATNSNPTDPVYEHLPPDQEVAELPVRFEEYDEGGLSHYEFVDEPGLVGVITEQQRLLVTGEVPLEKVLVRAVGKDKKTGIQQYAPYLPWTFYVDALNKLTLWNWELVIDEWWETANSVNCTGKLLIHGRDRTIKIPCDGGAAKRANSQTPADLRKTARADMIKGGATWFGIGLCLKDDRFKEEALTLHGVQNRPEAKQRNTLRELLKDPHEQICPKDQVHPRLEALGLQFEDWEFESEKRYDAILVAARQALRRRG